MSRHSQAFDRVACENKFATAPISMQVHSRHRGPIFERSGGLRSEIEKVVNRVYRGSRETTRRAVVFASIEPGNGCSWICAHTADLLSTTCDGSVCLVDANLRSPSLHDYMGVSVSRGLADLVSDRALDLKDVVSQIDGTQLWVLPAGHTLGSTDDCLAQSDKMRDRINEIRRRFDYVLIDVPAVSICNDAAAIGQASDGVILVVRAGSARRDVVRRITGELASSGTRLLGAILNDYTSPLPRSFERWL